MAGNDTEVVIVGGGAAGIAAGRRLTDAAGRLSRGRGARPAARRTGLDDQRRDDGRRSISAAAGLHSADRNPWADIAKGAGPHDRQDGRRHGCGLQSRLAFHLRSSSPSWRPIENSVSGSTRSQTPSPDGPRASTLLDPSGALEQLDQCGQHLCERPRSSIASRFAISTITDDSGVNWARGRGLRPRRSRRTRAGVSTALGCAVQRIDHSAPASARGDLERRDNGGCRHHHAADERHRRGGRLSSRRPLPVKIEAAAGLPLGLADKLFLSLSDCR